MTPRPGLLASSLLLLGACAAPAPTPFEATPVALRRVAASDAAWVDPWSLLPATPAAAPAASPPLAPQGPGRRFKPQPSLASTRLMLNDQQLDEDYWRPTSRHYSLGLETSFEREGDWFGGEGGFFFVMEDDEGVYVIPGQGNTKIKIDLMMLEVYGGLHRTFLRGSRLRPYIGAGATAFWIDADQVIRPTFGDKVTDGESQLTYGLYAHGGISYQLSRNFQIGLDARVVGFTHTAPLAGSSGDVDYRQLSIFLGYGG